MSKNTALSPSQSRFRIGDALVQPDRLVVCVDGIDHAIEPRVMDVLLMLAENAGETVSTYQFLADLWEDTNCGDNPVHKAITCLRGVFGDSPRESRYIETIRKRGYRLIAPVVYPGDYRRIPLKTGDWKGGSPFVGLSAFDSAHTSVFCGRSRTKVELLGAMRRQIDLQHRFVLVVGASGCGKTSLLQAGALPMLQRKGGFDGLETLSHAHCDLAGVEPADAAGVLAGALAQWRWGNREVFPPMPASDLVAHLKARPESVSGSIQEALRRHPVRDLAERPHAHLLLCIDHAESLVSGQSQDAESIRAFDSLLHCLCEAPRTLVVMIVRGDFYLKLVEALPGIAERKGGDGHVDVLTPRPGEIAEIVRTPAALAGLAYERDEDTALHLDDVLRDAAVAQPDALPLLQHTLQALYERRDGAGQLLFSAYHAIGGLEGALAHRAEEVFATLPENAQRSLDAVLSQMVVVQPENDSISARRVVLSALGDDARRLAETFVRARLFVAELDGGAPIVRVAHEALLRQWPRARDWAQDNRRILQARVRLQRAAERWVEEGKRDDHLLNPGGQMTEALEVRDRLGTLLAANETGLISASSRKLRRIRAVKTSAIVAIVLLALISSAMAVRLSRSMRETESHRKNAQSLANYMLGKLSDELRVIDRLDLLDGISTESIAYLSSMEGGDYDEAETALLARSYRTIGEVQFKQGRADDAGRLFARSLSVAERGLRRSEDDPRLYFEHGNSAYWYGYLCYEKGDYDCTERYWRTYLLDSDCAYRKAETSSSTLDLSYALSNLGTLLFDQGRVLEASSFFERSVRMKERAVSLSPDAPSLRFDRIDSRSWLSRARYEALDLRGAADAYDRQIVELRALLEQKPDAEAWRQRLANLLMLSARADEDTGRAGSALDKRLESRMTMRKLADASPTNDLYRKDLAFADYHLARSLCSNRDRSGCGALLDEASALVEQLAGTPAAKKSLRQLALDIAILKRIHRLQGDARSSMAAAIASLESPGSGYRYDRIVPTLARAHALQAATMPSGDPKRRRELDASMQLLLSAKNRSSADWLLAWREANRLAGNAVEEDTATARLCAAGFSNLTVACSARDAGRPPH